MVCRIHYILIFLFLVAACGDKEWRTHSIDNTGIAIDFPSNTKINTRIKESDIISIYDASARIEGEASYKVTVVDFHEGGGEVKLNESLKNIHSNATCEKFIAPGETIKLSKKGTKKIAGKTAYFITCISDKSEVGSIYLFARNNQHITLTIYMFDSRYKSKLEYFLSNVKFIDSKG